MKKLVDIQNGSIAKIRTVDGNQRFLSRITSIGLTPGSEIQIIKNSKRQPILIFSRDTLVAINRQECEYIYMEE
jgi:ferrous iron transport protein A